MFLLYIVWCTLSSYCVLFFSIYLFDLVSFFASSGVSILAIYVFGPPTCIFFIHIKQMLITLFQYTKTITIDGCGCVFARWGSGVCVGELWVGVSSL